MIGEIRQNFTEASASVGLILATALGLLPYKNGRILVSLRVFRMKCQYVWPLLYHLGLRVEKYPNKKSNAVTLCWSTTSVGGQIKSGPCLLWSPFRV